MEINGLTAQITIPVPDGFKVVEENEWKRLASLANDQPLVGDKNWVRHKVKISTDKILEETLINPFYEELKSQNGGPINFGTGSGSPWKVNKEMFEKWYNQNFIRIYG